MKLKDIQGEHTIRTWIEGQATAGTADEFTVGIVPFRATVTEVTFTPDAAITGNDTNNFSAQLRNRGAAAAGTTDIATLAFASGVDGVAFVPETITLSAAAADLNVAEGDVLTLEKVNAGTGLAMPAGLVTVKIKAR